MTPALEFAMGSAPSDFASYPFLTSDEFVEVCHHFDRLYRQATLGPIRRRWRLSVRTALNLADFVTTTGSDYTTFLQITRPLEDAGAGDDDDELLGKLGQFSLNPAAAAAPQAAADNGEGLDQDMIDAENADQAVLPKAPPVDVGSVTYEVHLHPTYRAPCLWFSLHDLPVDEPAFNIDTVFRRLVPDQFKDSLRAVGSTRGISVDYNPTTGVPSFFVHPCLLGEAMSDFNCSKENYLMVWLGLVGGCVGLWVPKEMALGEAPQT